MTYWQRISTVLLIMMLFMGCISRLVYETYPIERHNLFYIQDNEFKERLLQAVLTRFNSDWEVMYIP